MNKLLDVGSVPVDVLIYLLMVVVIILVGSPFPCSLIKPSDSFFARVCRISRSGPL